MNGGCAQLYAWAESHEAPFLLNGEYVRGVMIWHNDKHRSLNKALTIQNCYNDHFVNFKSTVSFRRFCEQFAYSEYDKPGNYHLFLHNCANAAHFALLLAGIPIMLPRIPMMSRLMPHSFVRLPVALTPTSLYEVVQEHKITEVRSLPPLSAPLFRAELASSAFFLLKQNGIDPKHQKSYFNIESEVFCSIQKNPQQSELFLRALLKSIRLLEEHIPLAPLKIFRYRQFATTFETRELSEIDKEAAQIYNRLAILFLAIGIQCMTGIFHSDFFWTAIVAVASASLLKTMSFIPSSTSRNHPKTPTVLSIQMKELARTLSEATQDIDVRAPSPGNH